MSFFSVSDFSVQKWSLNSKRMILELPKTRISHMMVIQKNEKCRGNFYVITQEEGTSYSRNDLSSKISVFSKEGNEILRDAFWKRNSKFILEMNNNHFVCRNEDRCSLDVYKTETLKHIKKTKPIYHFFKEKRWYGYGYMRNESAEKISNMIEINNELFAFSCGRMILIVKFNEDFVPQLIEKLEDHTTDIRSLKFSKYNIFVSLGNKKLNIWTKKYHSKRFSTYGTFIKLKEFIISPVFGLDIVSNRIIIGTEKRIRKLKGVQVKSIIKVYSLFTGKLIFSKQLNEGKSIQYIKGVPNSSNFLVALIDKEGRNRISLWNVRNAQKLLTIDLPIEKGTKKKDKNEENFTGIKFLFTHQYQKEKSEEEFRSLLKNCIFNQNSTDVTILCEEY